MICRKELQSSRLQKRTLTFAKDIPVVVLSLEQLLCYHPSLVCYGKYAKIFVFAQNFKFFTINKVVFLPPEDNDHFFGFRHIQV